MKIENIELLDFSKTEYSTDILQFDKNKMYLGFMDEESAQHGLLLEAVAFGVDNLHIADNKLYGNFNLINAKATELLVWIDTFDVNPVVKGVVEEGDDGSQTVLSAELVSFFATPN